MPESDRPEAAALAHHNSTVRSFPRSANHPCERNVGDTRIGLELGSRGICALASDNEPEILTPQEAADFLRVPLLTVQRQAKAGRLPGRRVGKEWRFSRTMLTEWVASGPDRHDLELYDRKVHGGTEHGKDEEGQPE